MNRRQFLAALAAAGLIPPLPASAQNPFDPDADDFPLEKQAQEIAAHLNRFTGTRTLPFAPTLQGVSPLPARYTTIAENISKAEYNPAHTDVAAGLAQWLDSLAPIRAARFYVLPNNLIRFEIASPNQYRVGFWNQHWKDGQLTQFSPIEETVVTATTPLFRDITAHAFQSADSFNRQLRRGIPYWRAHLDAASGIDVHGHNGIAVGDIDNDGIDEIYICQPGGLPNRLYKNHAGILEDITEKSGVGVLDPTSSALFLDLRNSGLQDLVVLRPDGPLLFVNQGAGRFAHQPGAFRFRTAPQGSFTGMAAADYDRDGRVDVYLCTYSFFRDGNQYRYPTPYYDAQNGPPNFLFHNQLEADGTGAFVDVTEAAGLSQNNNRFSFAPAWCDYNNDGWPDLYVANDFGRKNLYKNEAGKFRDVAAEAGVEDIGDGMSAAWFDYDGDGRPDLYVSNMWSDAGQRIVSQKHLEPAEAWQRHAKGNSLFRNKGDGAFEETGNAQGAEMGRWAWASDGIDFDNDGMPEIFIATGMLTNSSETDLESFFWRKVAAASPAAASSDAAYESGWDQLSRAVHEKYSEAGHQPNVFYVRHGDKYYDFSGVSGLDVAEDSRAFAVTDFDGDGNLDLVLKSRLGPQVRLFQNACGHSRKSIAFCLRGMKSNRDAIGARIEVDGKVKFVAAGSGYLSQHSKVIHFGLSDRETAQLIRISWPSGRIQGFRALAAGYRYEIEEGSQHTKAAAFAPRVELPAGATTGDNETHFADTWLLKPVPLPEQTPGPAFLRLSNLTGERASWYSLFCRYLFDLRADVKLPVWFLVDDRSRAHKIYFSPPDPADLPRLKDRDRLTLALPAPGRYYREPERNYTALGAAFAAAGHPEQALRYLEEAPQDNSHVLFAIGKIHLQAQRWDRARKSFEKGLALSPDSADAWNSLGAVEVGSNNLPAALRHFQRALEARRDYAPAIENLAALYASAGKSNDAIAAWRYGIEVAPDHESFYLNLATFYHSLDNRDAARSLLESLLARNPANARAKQALRELDRR
jgi:Flp pilus assembly protein TadD